MSVADGGDKMTQTASLAALRRPEPPAAPVNVGFDTTAGFDALQRMAKLFCNSTLVPKDFQGENNIGNAAIALDMALRMNANPLMVMQNLYIVYGRPAWSAQFLIATCNKCGRFSSLRYEFQGKEHTDAWGCRAIATELATGEKLEGPLVTLGLAKKEGWYGKNGSKWQSMPELMLRYRAASWFIRSYAPEIAMGLQTAEEIGDTVDLEPSENGTYIMSMSDMSRADSSPAPQKQEADPDSSSSSGEEMKKESKDEAKGKPGSPSNLRGPSPLKTYSCPRKDGAAVTDDDCFHCPERKGCPEH